MDEESDKNTDLDDSLNALREKVGKGKRAPRVAGSIFAPREYSVLRAKAIVRGLIGLLAVLLIAEAVLVTRTLLPDFSFGEDGPPIATYAAPEIDEPIPSGGGNKEASTAITQTVDRDNLFAEEKVSPTYKPPPEPEFSGEVEFPPIE